MNIYDRVCSKYKKCGFSKLLCSFYVKSLSIIILNYKYSLYSDMLFIYVNNCTFNIVFNKIMFYILFQSNQFKNLKKKNMFEKLSTKLLHTNFTK